ncbi:histidine ammonia-lyase [Virgibacillus dakarensis]|uniref:histidine ammonia-lyase n=1 Tax=Virgibacillus dakarensis TaxID=1917889 RepID=UPI00135633C6|nr:histidine ammonia-lyase [Virgibacillus dakarensis]MBT2216311.1 histidine ammonia-lyase [Virgibacillus dakarensis]
MRTDKKIISISAGDLSIEDLISIARHNVPIELSKEVEGKIIQARDLIDKFVDEQRVVYGITTGVGDNSKVRVSKAESRKLQKNLIRSHACGVGAPLDMELVKAVMVMMIKNLSSGYSGIRLETVQALVKLVNHNIVPKVPRDGSLGYLSYQAHISLVLLGEGEAYYKGELLKGDIALKRAGLKPISLYEKEGLSLINGTVDMTAIGAIAIYDAINVLKIADLASMVSFEALKGTNLAFDVRLGDVKPHPGLKSTIYNLNRLLSGSEIAEKFKNHRTQDALSIRAIPQVHGACKDALNYAKQVIEREMNSATDNPLIFVSEGDSVSSANCHGESVAMALDFLAISLSETANISERRIFRLVSSQYSELPPFLVENSGVNSGYMIPQYVAAALVSDNKLYSHPAVVDSIPTAAGQEDHVSMGTSASLKVLKVIANTQRVMGIELMCACQGLEFLRPLRSSTGIETVYNFLRSYIPKLEEDKVLYDDIKKVETLIKTEKVLDILENKIGQLVI